MRAVAVLPVLLFHGGLTSGGFIGVDIFFVISGYLICSIILGNLQSGNFTFASFYERRARRILPALYLVTIVSAVFAYCLMTPIQLRNFGKSLIAVTTFTSNILFYSEKSYFAEPLKLVPLLHTWSLAVEEQFYLLFPLFMYLMWRFARNYIHILLVVFILVSISYAQHLAVVDRSADFYLLPTRFWELMVGALLAYNEMRDGRASKRWMQNVLPSLGFAAIVFSIFWISKNSIHPGYITLIPVLGTAMVIWYSGSNDLLTKILTTKTLVAIGLMSYSIYLWHLPILVYFRMYNLGNLSFIALATYIPLSMLLAYCSWRWVETPFRNRQTISSKQLWVSIGLVSSTLIIFGWWLATGKLVSNVIGLPDSVIVSMNADHNNKLCKFNNKESWYCTMGKQKPHFDFAVTGDSHAKFTVTALRTLAQARGAYGVGSTYMACPPIFDPEIHGANAGIEKCNDLRAKMFEFVREHKIKNVFLAGRWSKYEHRKGKRRHEEIKQTLQKTVQQYNSIGAKVFLLLQVPEQQGPASEIYKAIYRAEPNQREHKLQEYSTSYLKYLDYNHAFNQIVQELQGLNLVIINPGSALCSNGTCYVGTVETSYYDDDHHLSRVGAQLLTPLLNDIFKKYKIAQAD